ncbi:MAG: tetratricopeptide repeat protein, partial [Hyphomicrobiaceae bacterium]|nr:tetratricopeptide repeat protein [Hyphomicrobiaceae bacterium]
MRVVRRLLKISAVLFLLVAAVLAAGLALVAGPIWYAEHLNNAGRYEDAIAIEQRYLKIAETIRGPDDPLVSLVLNGLAESYLKQAKFAEAEQLYRRALAIDEKSFGPEHPEVARKVNNMAQLLQATNRLAEAEPLMRQALAIDEKSIGPEHPNVARILSNLAGLLQATNRLAEAEPLMRRALAIDEKSPEHPNVATDLNNLSELLRATNRLVEAEPLMRRALAIDEKRLGPEHTEVATVLSNLAGLLQATNRLAEAEPLMRRALAIDEKGFGPEHPNVAIDLNNLAQLLQVTNRLADAEPLMRRALAIDEKSFGSEHPEVATDLNNLAQLLKDRLAEAEPLMRRALAIDEKSSGPEHPNVARDLNNLAQLLKDTNRPAEAEPLMSRALAIDEKSFGTDHPDVARNLNNLAILRAVVGDWAEAARLHRRAKPTMTGAQYKEGGSLAKAALTQNSGNLRAAARAVHRAGGDRAEARAEGFELAQWALQTGAADALVQMAVRFAKGDGPLAGLVRERQDLIVGRQGEDKRLLAAVGKADAKAAEAIRAAIAGLDGKLAAIDTRLAAEFPEYAQLANPKPLTIAAVQSLLREDEALVLFLDVPRIGTLPEETLAWAITKDEARWISVPPGTAALAERVAKLRCGLDRDGQWAWSGQRWQAKGERCRALRPEGLDDDASLPFDFGIAHELYAQLLAPFADLTKGKRLLIVPTGPLTSLPFHVLVTSPSPLATPTSPQAPTAQAESRDEGHPQNPTSVLVPPPYPRPSPGQGSSPLPASGERQPPAWLVLTQPITVLPSVGSLAALRGLPPSQAGEPYIGFGNPLLEGGAPGQAALARAKQTCPLDLETVRQRMAEAARGLPGLASLV